MRIGFFSDSYFPEIDGVTYTLKSWRERLERKGHEVYIIYPDSPDYDPGRNEIPVPSVPNPFYSGYRIPLPATSSRVPELDLVHCHSPFIVGILGRYVSWKQDIPAVYTHHTPLEEYFEQATHSQLLADGIAKLYLPLENSFLRSFDEVTASSGNLNREVDPVELPVGIDMEFFQHQDESFIDDLELERPVTGYSGRLSLEKNVSEILEFARDFSGSVLIVGEGPQKQNLVDQAPENVVFKDFLDREKLPEFYSGIDLFVTASTGDTLGLATLEANACGTPVVAPDIYPFNETIGKCNGARYTPGDIDEMRSKVENYLQNDRETVEAVKKYSLSKTVEKLENIYRGLDS